jgi:hypothetical protein
MDERGERTPEHPGDLFVEHDEKQDRKTESSKKRCEENRVTTKRWIWEVAFSGATSRKKARGLSTVLITRPSGPSKRRNGKRVCSQQKVSLQNIFSQRRD